MSEKPLNQSAFCCSNVRVLIITKQTKKKSQTIMSSPPKDIAMTGDNIN